MTLGHDCVAERNDLSKLQVTWLIKRKCIDKETTKETNEARNNSRETPLSSLWSTTIAMLNFWESLLKIEGVI
jgi:hypothetical protein